MATSRELKNRITSVKNTRKITRTMELVSTAKSKRAVDRVVAAKPFADKIQELLASLGSAAAGLDYPLLRKPDKIKKIGLFVITANRGLCGGFNNNVAKKAELRIKELAEEGTQCETHVAGKKGLSIFKFSNIPFEKGYTHIEDKPSYEEAVEIADYFMQAFIEGEIDMVQIAYTKYFSAGSQKAHLQTILPLTLDDENGATASNAIFEPNAAEILSSLLPRAIRIAFYQALLDSVASEQIARRVAMKNATEAASDMIKDLNLLYNRTRQAKITQEIAEIVGGAMGLK